MGKNIEKEMKLLTTFRDTTKERVKILQNNGYKPIPHVLEWLEDVEKLENELESIQQTNSCLNGILLCHSKTSSRRAALVNLEKSIQWLRESGIIFEVFDLKLVSKFINLLIDDKVSVIGVWGMAGVGKTLLMKTLNNELVKNPSKYPPFDVVIYVTVSQPLDLSNVQRQIGRRLGLTLDEEEPLITSASKIYRRLLEEKNFLIIFDDVWEAFELCEVGVPRPEQVHGSKVILTSRDKDVFTYISKGVKVVKVHTLNEEESWKLFANTAGFVVNYDHIEPIARDITQECGGLPLAIEFLGKSMKNQNDVTRWQRALELLRNKSEPNCLIVDKKIFINIKKSYDSLKRESISKYGHDIQNCFLYCSLYLESIPIDTLVRLWHEEGFLGDKDIEEYKIWYKKGIQCVERLVNASLLEQDGNDSVKMHALVRHVALWIALDK